MALGKLLAAAGRQVVGPPAAVPVSKVTADSRQVIPGALFVAVSGGKADGHAFLVDAVARGCVAVVVEKGRRPVGLPVPVIEMADTRTALARLLAALYDRPAGRMVMIGITGTNGKTTTSYLVESMILAAGGRPGVIGTVNYRCGGFVHPASLTTPDPENLQMILARMADQGVTHVIMEVSSHALAQKRLAGVAFDVAAFTNLSRDHLDYHRDMKNYFSAKKLLFLEHLKKDGVAVITMAAAAGRRSPAGRLVEQLQQKATRLVVCGRQQGEVRPLRTVLDIRGTRMDLQSPAGRVTVRSGLVGGFNLDNLLTAAGIGVALGLDGTVIGAGLSVPVRVPGRLEQVSDRPLVFVDYAHTPDALYQVLTALRALVPGRLVVVFGCGGDRDRGKRPRMGEIAARLADVTIITSDNPRSEAPAGIVAQIEAGVRATGRGRQRAEVGMRRGWRGFYDVVICRRQAIRVAVTNAGADDVVLIAGKGHEDYQLIGGRRIFFDDRLEVENCCSRLAA